MSEAPEAAQQEPGARQQHQRRCHLTRHQRVLKPTAFLREALASAFAVEPALGAPDVQSEDRRDAEQQRARAHGGDSKEQGCRIERDLFSPGERGHSSRESAHETDGENRSAGAACAGDAEALEQMIDQQTTLRRAERHTDRELMPSSFCAGEQHVADVGAREQEHERRGSQEREHRGLQFSHGGFLQGRGGERMKAGCGGMHLSGRRHPP